MSRPTPARRVAYETLRRVFEEGAWADRALRSAASRVGIEGRERAQAQALAYGAVQRRGSSDYFAALLADRRVAKIDPPLLAALRLGLYELLWAESADHAAVDQAVSLAKGPGGRRRGAGLVNAVLRRAARERETLLGDLSEDDPQAAALMHSVPEWLAELWWSELGAGEARSLLAAVNRPAERAFRVSSGDVEGLLERAPLQASRAAGPGPAPEGLIVVDGGEWEWVEEAIAEGELVPQSRASALVVDVLAPRPGERVLDLCAGPGIKASAIAASLGDDGRGLVAVERDPGRAAELRELLARTGAPAAEVIEADAAGPPPEGGFDAVLVDPPCTGLGTLASRPDARWRRSPTDIAELAALEAAILARGLEALRPGGRLVYSTCTISRAENEAVVAAAGGSVVDLGAAHPGLASAEDPRCLQTRPDRDGTDGFFIASLLP
ncbi:MAG: RsmB/NOP family class I SAM-dependent RNA methyltransferase [Solirubrobacterales bacterium]